MIKLLMSKLKKSQGLILMRIPNLVKVIASPPYSHLQNLTTVDAVTSVVLTVVSVRWMLNQGFGCELRQTEREVFT